MESFFHLNQVHGSYSDLPRTNLDLIVENPNFKWIKKKWAQFATPIGLQYLFRFFRDYRRHPENFGLYVEQPTEPIFRYDFHCHSTFSDGLGSYTEILANCARLKHLSGLVLSDHPFTEVAKKRTPNPKVIENSYKVAEAANLMKSKGQLPPEFLMFPGSCEFAVPLSPKYPKRSCELVVIGVRPTFIDELGGLEKIRKMFAQDFIEQVHNHNGLAILPHPFYFTQANYLLTIKPSDNPIRHVDAFEEINHTIHYISDVRIREQFHRAKIPPIVQTLAEIFAYFNWMARNTVVMRKTFPGASEIARVGSSDAHVPSFVGSACSRLPYALENAEDLRKALHLKAFTPCLNEVWESKIAKETVFQELVKREVGEVVEKINEFHEKPLIYGILLAGLKILYILRKWT